LDELIDRENSSSKSKSNRHVATTSSCRKPGWRCIKGPSTSRFTQADTEAPTDIRSPCQSRRLRKWRDCPACSRSAPS